MSAASVPWLIVLSGASCSGKTTLAGALAERMSTPSRPFLNIEADRLLPHLPLVWTETQGMHATRISQALHRAIAAFADQGFDVIVDGVLPYDQPEGIADAFKTFEAFSVCAVGVYCDVAALEQREKVRPDRVQGWSRKQAADLHLGQRYDVEVDTTSSTPQQCAESIAQYLLAADVGG